MLIKTHKLIAFQLKHCGGELGLQKISSGLPSETLENKFSLSGLSAKTVFVSVVEKSVEFQYMGITVL